jgi:hypothetical protein
MQYAVVIHTVYHDPFYFIGFGDEASARAYAAEALADGFTHPEGNVWIPPEFIQRTEIARYLTQSPQQGGKHGSTWVDG